MTIQELGSIGEFVAAIATIATLAYLAVQVRHNTRALRSSTFQDISGGMNQISEAIATHPELSALLVRGPEGLDAYSAEERIRFNFLLLMSFRRLESVYIQSKLGTIENELTAGFERSLLSVIASGAGREWWDNAKPAFSQRFVDFVDDKLSTEKIPRIHLGIGGSI